MNFQEWKEKYKNKSEYKERMIKKMHAFVNKNPNFTQTVLYPEPLIISIQEKIKGSKIHQAHYEGNETWFFAPDVSKNEMLILHGTINGLYFTCTLSITHETKRTISFYHNNGENNENLDTDSLFSVLYNEMLVFVQQYSPSRLNLVTNEYMYELPSFLSSSIQEEVV